MLKSENIITITMRLLPLVLLLHDDAFDDVADFEERTRFCLEMGKKYMFRALTRLHIAAWNKTLNV